MILSAHQAHYLPWLGHLDKIDRSDIFVLLDDVQYEKREWQNRNRIRTSKGWQWLTVPVHAHLSDRMMEVRIVAESSWRKDHMKSLEWNYSKAPCFSSLWDFLRGIYERDWTSLVELNVACLESLMKVIGLEEKRFIRSSSLGLTSQATERLVDLCKYFHADTYLSGDGAHAYLDAESFKQAGIRVEFQNFSHPVYFQFHEKGRNFIEGLSSVDLLFNHGKDGLEILRKARRSG